MGKFAFGVAMVHHDFGVALLASIVRDGEGGGDAGAVDVRLLFISWGIDGG